MCNFYRRESISKIIQKRQSDRDLSEIAVEIRRFSSCGQSRLILFRRRSPFRRCSGREHLRKRRHHRRFLFHRLLTNQRRRRRLNSLFEHSGLLEHVAAFGFSKIGDAGSIASWRTSRCRRRTENRTSERRRRTILARKQFQFASFEIGEIVVFFRVFQCEIVGRVYLQQRRYVFLSRRRFHNHRFLTSRVLHLSNEIGRKLSSSEIIRKQSGLILASRGGFQFFEACIRLTAFDFGQTRRATTLLTVRHFQFSGRLVAGIADAA